MDVTAKHIEQEPLLTEVDAARYLRMSERTLRRCSGVGPKFIRVGRAVRYRRSDLVAWVEANTVVPKECGG